MKIHSVIAATLAFFFLLSGQARAQESLPQLVKKIQPAVVTVIAYDAKGKPKVQGSGFFIDQFGEFLTNSHVLEGASRAEVKTFQGRRFPVLGIEAQDQAGDLVIAAADLKKEKTHFLNISPSRPEVGERVAVVGSPLGLEQTLSEGVVSAVRQVPDIGEILQITAPISRGSSGSPVVNMKGEVIGVATFIFKEGQNLNFAVPGSRALALRPKGRYVLIEPLEKTPETSTKPPYGEEVNKFIKARNYEKATEVLKRRIRLHPDDAFAHFWLGEIYIRINRPKEAAEAYKQAIRLEPDNPASHFGMGLAYGDLGRKKEAAQAFKEAIRLKPDYPWAHLLLGGLYLDLGDRSAAWEEYKVLKTLDPKLANKLFNSLYE